PSVESAGRHCRLRSRPGTVRQGQRPDVSQDRSGVLAHFRPGDALSPARSQRLAGVIPGGCCLLSYNREFLRRDNAPITPKDAATGSTAAPLGWNGREISMSQRSNFAAEQLPRSYSRLAICMTGLLALVAYAVWLMPHVPTEQPVPIIAAIFVAALVSSVAGFAFSAICGAMLFHLVEDPVQAIQIMMVCSVGGQAWMVWALRRDIVWRSLSIFLVGAAAGPPGGVFCLLHSWPCFYAPRAGGLLVS